MNDNPNAFKLWINHKTVEKYFRNSTAKNRIPEISKAIEPLELRARCQLIAQELAKTLPSPYPKGLNHLLKILRDNNLKSFELWPATEWIQSKGLEHLEISLKAMEEITQIFTAEFCIRPFLIQHPTKTYDHLLKMADSSNEHLRRWASEGSRPRLPWGMKLKEAIQDPSRGLEILEKLKFDPSLYVRKSVSNHLNDISKDHPDLVIQTLKIWKKQKPDGFDKEWAFLQRQSVRTLIKQGHSDTLDFLGLNTKNSKIEVKEFSISKKRIKVGDDLHIELKIKNLGKKSEKMVLDFCIGYLRQNQTLSWKVFKLKTKDLASGESLAIEKKISFKPVTTRKLYSGRHQVCLQLNGKRTKGLGFELVGGLPTR